MINHGLEQSDRIIIDKPNLTDGYMIRSIYGHVERGAAIEEVWAKEPEGKIRLLYEKKTGNCRKTDARMQRIGSH